MLKRQTLSAQYWNEALKITDSDTEYLFSVMLEDEHPLSSLELARLLIQHRVRQEDDLWRKRLAEGQLFQPNASYEIGQRLVFPVMDFAVGNVVGTRQGSSLEYGNFTVIQVKFEDDVQREFASELQAPHALDMDNGHSVENLLDTVDVEALLAQHGRRIADRLEQYLANVDDVVYAAGLWFLKSLLPTINEGQVHLAEAILDMYEGGPLAPEEILPVLELPKEVNPRLQAFALNHVLYHDQRFDEVGPMGLVRWYLRRLEPEEVRSTPPRLLYRPIPYDPAMLSEQAMEMESAIADEFSDLPTPETIPDHVRLTLLYPHRRSGTLPLNAALAAMFPTAYEASRIRITFVDQQASEQPEDPKKPREFEGWVVQQGRYVFGLDRFYKVHQLPIGAYIHITRTDDPGRFIIDYKGHRPRTEWILVASVENNQIRYQNQKRSIGAQYDEMMVLGMDDQAKIDQVWRVVTDQQRSLSEIIRELLTDLARLSRQGAVHFKTLYSAVNVVRRCPPGPILALLEAQPEFESVGDHYWQLRSG